MLETNNNLFPKSETKLTSVRNGKESTKTGAEIVKEEIALAKKLGDKEKVKQLSQAEGEKATYREFLYKTQDMYTKKIEQKKIDLMNSGSAKEREAILAEVRDMGRFCRALEEEIRWLRNH